MSEANLCALPYPLAAAVQSAVQPDIPALQLKRIGQATNKIMRFLAWLAVAKTLHEQRPLRPEVLQLIYKKRHLNSDWVRILEGVGFQEADIRVLANMMVMVRNQEAHAEEDPRTIPQSLVDQGFGVMWDLVANLAAVLQAGELIWVGTEQVCLTGPDAAGFRRKTLLAAQSQVESGLYWMQRDGVALALEPFMAVAEGGAGIDLLVLDQIGKESLSYASTATAQQVVRRGTVPLPRPEVKEQLPQEEVEELFRRVTDATLNAHGEAPLLVERAGVTAALAEFQQLGRSLALVIGRAGAGVSALLRQSAVQYRKKLPVLLVDGVPELMHLLDGLAVTTHGLAILPPCVIVVDHVSGETDLLAVMRLVEGSGSFDCKLILGGRPHLQEKAAKLAEYWKVAYAVVEVGPLSDDEVRTFIHEYAARFQAPPQVKGLQSLLQTAGVTMRTPAVLKLLCDVSAKGQQTITWLNAKQMYTLYEERVIMRRDLLETVNFLCQQVKRKRLNQVSFRDAQACGSHLDILTDLGVIEQNLYGYCFVSEEYLHYKVASLVFAEKGRVASWSAFTGWDDAIPYYVALLAERLELSTVGKLLAKIPPEVVPAVLDSLLPYPRALSAFIALPGMFEAGLALGRGLRDQGVLGAAIHLFSTMQQVPRLPAHLADQLNAEIMLTRFLLDGTVTKVSVNEAVACPQHFAYQAFIDYIQDRYRAAHRQYTRAIALLQPDDPSWVKTHLDFAELLIDRAAYRQTDEVLAQALLGQTGPDSLARIANLRGTAALEQGHLPAALAHLEQALAQFDAAHNYNGIAKTHGDIGRTLTMLGEWDQARQHIAENIYLCGVNENLNGLAVSHQLMADLCFLAGDLPQALEAYNASLQYAAKASNTWRALTASMGCMLVSALMSGSPIDPGEWQRLKEGFRRINIITLWTHYYAMVAIATAFQDRPRAIRLAKRGRAIAARVGAGLYTDLCDALLFALATPTGSGGGDEAAAERLGRHLQRTFARVP